MADYKCNNCEKIINRKPSSIRNDLVFCSVECKGKWQKKNLKGKNNPNYKDGHTIISYCKCGKEKDFRAKVCNNCYDRKTFLGKKHTEISKKKIGKKSKEKFTPEFKRRMRLKMEENKRWVPLDVIDDYKFYKRISNWTKEVDDIIASSNFKNVILLEEKGKFHPWKNVYGIVRDHKFSRRSGFEQNVFPEILRHPCNLELITHVENIKKIEDSITLEELFDLIKKCNQNKWFEQQMCLDLIEKYKEGYRYNIDKYKEA